MAKPPPRATYQDVLDAPAHKVAEILYGTLVLSPRPAGAHSSVSVSLIADLELPFGRGRGGPGGWTFLVEPELHLDDDVCVPDLAGWRVSRMPVVADAPFFTLPPDWICEVLSRSTEKIDRVHKLGIYARAGVKHVWLVDARYRMLEVLRLHEGNWLRIGVFHDDDKVRAEPFEAVELELAMLWAKLEDEVPPTRALESPASYAR